MLEDVGRSTETEVVSKLCSLRRLTEIIGTGANVLVILSHL
jgi:hypothetical protein